MVIPMWKRVASLVLCFLLHTKFSSSQTTTFPTTTTAFNPPESTTSTTTFAPTLMPFFTTEGTTLSTADSVLPATTPSTVGFPAEATTEGLAPNGALRANGMRRGFRFESTRNKPSSNLEREPETETQRPTTQRPEQIIAWKFGRGANNQEQWAARPSPNSGYPVWKKETPTPKPEPVEQSTEPSPNKPNDQAYFVWNVGQNNQPNGWPVGANPDSWPPAGVVPENAEWVPADSSAENNPESSGWNSGEWSQDQSPENGNEQGWTGDDGPPNEGTAPDWENNGDEGWNSPNQNAGGWVNVQAQGQPPNRQPPNSWQPPGNGGGGAAWVVNPQQQGNNGQGGWVPPQQGGGWNSQPPQGGQNGGWNNNGGGWTPSPAPASGNSWKNSQPTQPGNGGCCQNSAGWNGSPGWQDENLSWKMYNEDTKTMENLDDNSGWKVVGDGGPEGWKLIDENGNVEWKIENVNGEWKVTSADEFANNTSSVSNDSTNATTPDATNGTATDIATTTPSPGGWEDDQQGRYIIWKFSEDGKGEARVYEGPGSDPDVWTVGDNNEWWKQTMAIKDADTKAKGGYNSGGGGNGQGSGRWQNTALQPGITYQNDRNNIPAQNGGWKSGGGGSQNDGVKWQQNRKPENGGSAWRNNGAPAPTGGNGWQAGGSQRGNSRWQNNGGTPPQQKWNNGVRPPQSANGWKNQPPQSGKWNTGNASPPASSGWQNPRPNSQPQGGNWQTKPKPQQSGWQNGATRSGERWANGGQAPGGRGKGRWRNDGSTSSGPNTANGAARSGPPKERAWNSGNGWQTAPGAQQQGKAGWENNSPTPPATTTPSGRSQTGRNKAAGWPGNNRGGQTVPYIIVIKAPDTGAIPDGPQASKQPQNSNAGNTKPQSNRRNGGWKMNRAGSSGWQWNPQGGSNKWQWRDGWMGSGGGFGGWTNDKGTMYSEWRPTKANGAQARNSPPQRTGSGKVNKKSASKMVFVFGTKRGPGDASHEPPNKGKKGKQVIIIDYTSGGKTAPKGEAGMKKDIESVIQALKTAKPTRSQRKQPAQKRKTQQWSQR